MDQYPRLTDGQVSLTFDPSNGSLVSLRNLSTGTELIAEPQLAESFRLLIPLPDYVSNYAFGTEQKLSRIEQRSNEAVLHWNRIRTVNGQFDIRVAMAFRLDHGVHVTITIDNQSDQTVEEVWGPIIGGFQGVGNPDETVLMPGQLRNPWRNFPDEAPNWGYPWPCRYITYPRPGGMQFIELHNGSEGLYLASEDPSGQVTGFHLEKRPYTQPCNQWIPKRVASGIHLAVTKHPFVAPGQRWISPPTIIWPHRGDWHRGAERYRAWAKTWMRFPEPAEWVRNFTGWQHTIMYTQSDAIHHRFEDVPRLAEVARSYGFPCVNLVGFHSGGIERGYPDFSPEPRLGGEAALRAAIQEAHQKDVRVLLFSKSHRAHANLPRFKNDLIRLAVKDRDGEVIANAYGYDTLDTRIMQQSRGRYAVMCPAVQEWQEIIAQETVKMARLGADGTQYDQICSAPYLCYDPTHQHRPTDAIGPGIYQLLDRVQQALRTENLDFVLTGEEPWDALYQWLQIGYCRHLGALEDSRLWKYTFPEAIQTVLVDMYDFDRVNRALLLGYPLDFEIRRWRSDLSEATDLARYAQWTAQVRRELPSHLMHGVFQDRQGVTVSGTAEYGVHQAGDGSLAVVLTNESNDAMPASVAASGRPKAGRIYRNKQPVGDYRAESEIILPPHGAAVVVL